MLSLTSRYPALISIFILILAIAASFYFYRNTLLSRFKKYLLISLKSVAIFLILTLLLEPALVALLKYNPEVSNIVLVDVSRSNLLNSNDVTKEEQIKELYGEYYAGNKAYSTYTFSSSGSPPIKINDDDSLNFDGFETNLSGALENLKKILPEDQFNSVTLISDGNFNSGGNPLYQAKLFNCPFTTIGIGDTIQKKDAVLDKILHNDIAFVDIITKITAYINFYDLKDEVITADLLREGIVVSSKNIEIKNNIETDEISFEVKESNPGIIKYRIRVGEKPGEVTYRNNRLDFLIEFVDNKVNLLLVSGGPGYDNALISDILKRTSNFNTTVKTAKNPGEFYEGPIDFKSFSGLSAVFLLAYPTTQTSNEKASELFSQIKSYNLPVIFFAGRNADYKKIELLDDLVPFTVTRTTVETLFNPQVISSLDNPFSEISSSINYNPQIFKNQDIQQKSGTEVLIIDKTSGEPIFITRKAAPGSRSSSTAFLGYGIWRWNLNPQKNNGEAVKQFIQKTVGLTLSKEKKTKFKIYPSKNIFDFTESIVINAEVYDENFMPSTNAKVKAKIISSGKTIMENLDFSLEGNRYISVIHQLPAGDYIAEAEAELNNISYAKHQTRFLVDTLNTEFKITKSSFDNLKQLSENTGGTFINPALEKNKMSEVLAIMNERNDNLQHEFKTYKFNLWENKYILILIIALFSAEWFIRKRNNIP